MMIMIMMTIMTSSADVAEKSRSYGVVGNNRVADDGYSRRGNFGGSLVHSMF